MALRQEGYWEEHYELELKNYMEDGDEGEIWFGKGLNRKIVDWLLKRLNSAGANKSSTRIDVIDIGCGNSFLLCSLVEKFRRDLGALSDQPSLRALGIDYSANSVNLSTKIVQDRQLSEYIELRECDFLNQAQVSSIAATRRFDVIIDKGTYDAICLLHGQSDENLKQTKEAYLRSVRALGKTGTVYILASCNHTQDELTQLIEFSEDFEGNSKLIDKIETPSIEFGGKSGSQVTCLIYEFI